MGRKPEEFDPRKFLAEAVKAAKELCQARFEAFGSAGMASRITPRPLDQMAAWYAGTVAKRAA
jgi:fructose-bisphosphate aldolase class II